MRLRSLLACPVFGTAACTPAVAEVGVAIGMPGISIGIDSEAAVTSRTRTWSVSGGISGHLGRHRTQHLESPKH